MQRREMHLVIGALIVASHSVISSGWLITLVAIWLVTAGAGVLMWRRTVWIPLLASIGLSAVWMIAFFGSR